MRQRSAVFLLAMISSLVWVWAAAAAESAESRCAGAAV